MSELLPSFMPEGPKNWPEDYAMENGNYMCCCIYCDGQFYGHKRRIVCKECSNLLPILHKITSLFDGNEATREQVSKALAILRTVPHPTTTSADVMKAAEAVVKAQAVFAKHIATEQIDVGESTVPGYPDDIAAKYGEHLGEIEELLSTTLSALARHAGAGEAREIADGLRSLAPDGTCKKCLRFECVCALRRPAPGDGKGGE